MDITYFNYDEIFIRARGDPAAIVLLTYAQSPMYNNLTTKELMKLLNINHIPRHLFTSKTLAVTAYTQQIICTYRTIEANSYINNPSFLSYGLNARQKMHYIKALSARKINSKENKIPRNYFDKVASNPLFEVSDDFIYFPLEAS